ncbi:TetR family transcriptional regulator [Nocardioides sp. NPDC051685]|uniref:TetR family transcriptional regulator n=1 Tax=Nocardioides sp. NPDC051685 TaxID=3364334 RepID=UPI0037AF576C
MASVDDTPVASRSELSTARRRRDIARAATELFASRGYGGATMDAIAEAAGVTKRTLYRYVPTKQDVLPLIHEQFLSAAEQLIPASWEGVSAERGLQEFIEAYVRVVVDHRDAVRVFFEEEYNLTSAAREQVISRRDAFEGHLRRLLAVGASSKTFRPINPTVASAAILGSLAETYRWYSPDGLLGVHDVSNSLCRLVVDGILADDSEDAEPVLAMPADVPELEAIPTIPGHVLEAAVKLFASQGFLETNTRDIADAAGITKSALFYHIGSKDDLLFAIAAGFGQASVQQLHDLMSNVTEKSAVAQLERVIVGHAKTMGERSDEVRVFVDQTRYLSHEKAETIERLRAAYVTGVESIIATGANAGVFFPVNTKVTTLAILGMLNSMPRWYRPQGPLGPEEVGSIFADLVIHGIHLE